MGLDLLVLFPSSVGIDSRRGFWRFDICGGLRGGLGVRLDLMVMVMMMKNVCLHQRQEKRGNIDDILRVDRCIRNILLFVLVYMLT